MDKEYLAHSAHDGFPAQTYLNHVQNVHDDAVRYAKEAAAFAAKQEDDMALVSAVTNAASLHDLGKLEEENQAALHAGNQPHLPINHTDAGTALLLHENKMYSAVCVMSHHRGLPDFPKECCHGSEAFRDTDIASATDSKLPELKAIHRDLFGEKTADEQPGAARYSCAWRFPVWQMPTTEIRRDITGRNPWMGGRMTCVRQRDCRC